MAIWSIKATAAEMRRRASLQEDSGNMSSISSEPGRPAPPMPECKPPMPEHQVLKVKAGDTVVISVDRVLMPEHRALMTQAVKDKFPDGVKVMVLDKGMTITVVSPQPDQPTQTTRRGGPVPHIPQPT